MFKDAYIEGSMKDTQITPFTFIDQCRTKKEDIPFNDKICSGYMLMLGISNYTYDLPVCNRINKYLFDMPNEVVYKYFFEALQQGKVYAKWPKKTIDKKLEKKLEELQKKYDISRFEAEQFEGVL